MKKYYYVATKDLKVGDYVRYSNGTYHKIVKISNKNLDSIVYNISVNNTHNFYVGNQQILVHNMNISGYK